MIIKAQDDAFRDRFLIEAVFINWFYPKNETYIVLEVYIKSSQTWKIGSISVTHSGIEDEPSRRIRINPGDRIYVMDDAGKTIDSKRIENEWVCPKCAHRNLPSEETCTGRRTISGTCGYARPEEVE